MVRIGYWSRLPSLLPECGDFVVCCIIGLHFVTTIHCTRWMFDISYNTTESSAIALKIDRMFSRQFFQGSDQVIFITIILFVQVMRC